MLIDDLKFDLRLYVLVYGTNPLRIYLFKEGLAWFATEEYEKPTASNMKNLFLHLTNYAINKESENFDNDSEGEDGHKRSLSAVLETISEMGFDINELMNRISDIIIKTVIAGQPYLW